MECRQRLIAKIALGGGGMPLLNKDKMLNGVGKAVDVVNHAADKAGQYVHDKEIDKKIEHAAERIGREAKTVGKNIKDTFSNKKS